MNLRNLIAAASFVVAGGIMVWLVACSGSGGQTHADAGVHLVDVFDGGTATVADACGDLFDAVAAAAPCQNIVGLPVTGLGSRDRFVKLCELHLGAAGAGAGVANAAERCAQTIAAATPTCAPIDPAACAEPAGTRAAGAACGTAFQCASGYCQGPMATAAERLDTFLGLASATGMTSCGVCVDQIPLGQACGTYPSQCNAGCQPLPVPCAGNANCSPPSGASCISGPEPGGGSSFTCVARPPALAAGAPCNTGACQQCGPGLTCNVQTSLCTPLEGPGGDCASGGDCGGGLVCDATGHCGKPLAVGAACDGGVLCAAQALCDTLTNVCTAVTFAAPGGACDNPWGGCISGSCTMSTPPGGTATGTCPAVIPDGQPCGYPNVAPCDQYATCAVAGSQTGCCYVGGPGAGVGSVDGGATSPAPTSTAPPAPSTTCILLDPSTCQ